MACSIRPPFYLGREAPWPCVRLLSFRNAQPPASMRITSLEQAWVPPQTNEIESLGLGLGIKSWKNSSGDFEKQSCLKTAVL